MPSLTPAQYEAITRHKYLGGPRPTGVPHISVADLGQTEYDRVTGRWAAFDRWYEWHRTGGPRPAGVWRKVPAWDSPGFTPWVLARALDKAHAHEPVPGQPPPPPPAIHFPDSKPPSRGRNGLYFYNWPPQVGEQRCIELAQQHQLWVALLVCEIDHTPYSDGRFIPIEQIRAVRDRLRAAGLVVVASGWADPTAGLASQAAAIHEYAQGFDEYMLNIEAAWSWPGPYDQPPPPGWGASSAFAPLVHQALGGTPLSLCFDWGNIIHWRPWLEAGAGAFRAQCYLNEWGHKSPKGAMERMSWPQGDLPGGIPHSMQEVVYGKYAAHPEPLATWTAYDDEAGQPPRSDWAAEFNTEADIVWLAR